MGIALRRLSDEDPTFRVGGDPEYRKKVLEAAPRGSEVTFRVDPSLIGGITILINKEPLIDGSVSKRVRKLFSR
jgi:hypothetical protein